MSQEIESPQEVADATTSAASEVVKPRRGRPRKVVEKVVEAPAPDAAASAQPEAVVSDKASVEDKPRRRGRPRKADAQNNTRQEEGAASESKEAMPESSHEQPRRARWKKGDRNTKVDRNNKRGRREEPEEKISDEMEGVSLNLKEISAKSPTVTPIACACSLTLI